jgi:hypothetical protein
VFIEMETLNETTWPQFLLQLLPGALPRSFVGAPSAQHSPVAKAAVGHLIIGDLDDELRPEGLPVD